MPPGLKPVHVHTLGTYVRSSVQLVTEVPGFVHVGVPWVLSEVSQCLVVSVMLSSHEMM